MKSVQVVGANELRLIEQDIPELKEDQVLIKIEYSLMCSSDVKLIKGQFHGLKLPLVPGHEFSGVVVKAAGSNQHLVGKKVVVDILSPCLKCEFCRKGRKNLCKNLEEIGVTLDGSYSEYLVSDARNVIVIPDDVDLKEASLIEPLAVVCNAVQRVGVKPSEKVAIIGSGVIGLLLTTLLKHMGASEVIVIDYLSERLEIAKKIGATCTVKREGQNEIDINSDVVFDATGSSEGFALALDIVKPGGRIGYISYSASEKVIIEPSKIMLKEIDIYGVLSPNDTWIQAIDLIKKGIIKSELLITHEFSLAEYCKVYDLMNDKKDGVIRAAFKI